MTQAAARPPKLGEKLRKNYTIKMGVHRNKKISFKKYILKIIINRCTQEREMFFNLLLFFLQHMKNFFDLHNHRNTKKF